MSALKYLAVAVAAFALEYGNEWLSGHPDPLGRATQLGAGIILGALFFGRKR
jgi:hypothetical protein